MLKPPNPSTKSPIDKTCARRTEMVITLLPGATRFVEAEGFFSAKPHESPCLRSPRLLGFDVHRVATCSHTYDPMYDYIFLLRGMCSERAMASKLHCSEADM